MNLDYTNISSILIDIGMIAVVVLLIVVLVKVLAAPIKGILKFLLHAGMGFLILLAVNYVGKYYNFEIPINWIVLTISGIGGIPGVLLVILYYLVF